MSSKTVVIFADNYLVSLIQLESLEVSELPEIPELDAAVLPGSGQIVSCTEEKFIILII